MRENEFETRVQQKLDALLIEPAGSVWERVSVQVTKQRQTRRRYLILPIFIVLLLASSLLLHDLEPVKFKNGSLANVDAHPKTERALASHLPSPGFPGTIQEDNPGMRPEFMPQAGLHSKKIVGVERQQEKIQRETIPASLQPEQETGGQVAILEGDKLSSTQVNSTTEPNNEPAVENIERGTAESTPTDSTATTLKATVPTDPPASKAKKASEKGRWVTGIAMSTGFGFAGMSTPPAGVAYDNSGVGSSPGSGNIFTPSSLGQGFNIGAGFSIARHLGRRVKLQSGLQYQLFTNTLLTGDRVLPSYSSSTPQAMYGSGKTNRYRNYFHSIDLPVEFSVEALRGKTKSLELLAGVSVSRLLFADALQFNSRQGFYYHDDALLRKMGMSTKAAVLLRFSGKRNGSFAVGPEIYYSLTYLGNTGIYQSARPHSFGLRLQKNF